MNVKRIKASGLQPSVDLALFLYDQLWALNYKACALPIPDDLNELINGDAKHFTSSIIAAALEGYALLHELEGVDPETIVTDWQSAYIAIDELGIDLEGDVEHDGQTIHVKFTQPIWRSDNK